MAASAGFYGLFLLRKMGSAEYYDKISMFYIEKFIAFYLF